MEQKQSINNAGRNLELEIVEQLLKDECHIRELARKLNINHMAVSRKIKNLIRENVVDFKTIGKNKVYFLKKTLEAKAYVFKTENYKLIKILKKYPELRRIIEGISSDKRIKLAILFGSYAKGIAGRRSDIDIYLETKDRQIKKDIENMNSKISIKIGEYNPDSLLIKEIEKSHVVLKGVEEFYSKNGDKIFE